MSGMELGIVFALSTAFSWALAGVIHTSASRLVGIGTLMLVRQPLATAALGVCCLLLDGCCRRRPPVLAGGRLGPVRDHHRRRLFLRRGPEHGAAPHPGVSIAVGQFHRSARRALSGRAYRPPGMDGDGGGHLRGHFGGRIGTTGRSQPAPGQTPPQPGADVRLDVRPVSGRGHDLSKQALDDGMGALPLAFYRNAISTGVIWAAGLARGAMPARLRRAARQSRRYQVVSARLPIRPRRGHLAVLRGPGVSARRRRLHAHRTGTHRPAYHPGRYRNGACPPAIPFWGP